MWTIDVTTADHDAVKMGIINQRISRVHLSMDDFPDPYDAKAFACVMACSIHGGMPTDAVICL